MAKAVEGRWTLKDQVTPAIQKINQNTLIYKKTLTELRTEGQRTWDELKGMSSFLGIGFVAAIGEGLKAGVEFQDQMARVSKMLDGDVKTKIATMSKQVLQLARDTGTSTSLITDGLYQTISAFGDTADGMSILETATKAATASGATVTDSINLLSAIMKGYGNVSAQTAKQVSDMAFLTENLGQTTFPELAASMGQAVPIASTLGISMKELFAAEATLSGVTGDTSIVTTGLRASFQALLAPTTEMQNALNKLGYSSGQAIIQSKGYKGALDLLVKSANGNTAELSKMFGQVEGLNQVLALTSAQSSIYDQRLNQMSNSAGEMETAYSRATDTIAHKWNVLVQTVNTAFIQQTTQKTAVDDLGAILTGVTNIFNYVNNHWSTIGPLVYTIVAAFAAYKLAALSSVAVTKLLGDAAAQAALKETLMGTAGLVAAGQMGIFRGAVTVLGATFKTAFTANPVGVVITLLGLLITAIIYVKDHIQELYLIGMKTWNGIVSVAQWAVNKYIDYADFLLRGYKFVWDSIKYYGISIWDAILSASQTGINNLLKLISPISGVLSKVGINIPTSVDFSAAKVTAAKPSWDSSFGIGPVDFGTPFGQDAIMEQTKKAQAEQNKQNSDYIQAITDNTNALTGNTDATNSNTDASNGLSGSLQNGVAVNLTPEQIADQLVPRLERHLYGAT